MNGRDRSRFLSICANRVVTPKCAGRASARHECHSEAKTMRRLDRKCIGHRFALQRPMLRPLLFVFATLALLGCPSFHDRSELCLEATRFVCVNGSDAGVCTDVVESEPVLANCTALGWQCSVDRIDQRRCRCNAVTRPQQCNVVRSDGVCELGNSPAQCTELGWQCPIGTVESNRCRCSMNGPTTCVRGVQGGHCADLTEEQPAQCRPGGEWTCLRGFVLWSQCRCLGSECERDAGASIDARQD